MTETTQNGTDISPEVLDTIVSLALNDVKGIESVGSTSTGFLAIFGSKQDNQGVNVEQVGDNSVNVSIVLTVQDGYPLKEIADSARAAIVDAILAQTGYIVNRVDIHVDGIVFQD